MILPAWSFRRAWYRQVPSHNLHYPADTRRNDTVIMTSKRRRFDVIMTLSLRHVPVGWWWQRPMIPLDMVAQSHNELRWQLCEIRQSFLCRKHVEDWLIKGYTLVTSRIDLNHCNRRLSCSVTFMPPLLSNLYSNNVLWLISWLQNMMHLHLNTKCHDRVRSLLWCIWFGIIERLLLWYIYSPLIDSRYGCLVSSVNWYIIGTVRNYQYKLPVIAYGHRIHTILSNKPTPYNQCPLLLTWFNFNPSMNK